MPPAPRLPEHADPHPPFSSNLSRFIIPTLLPVPFFCQPDEQALDSRPPPEEPETDFIAVPAAAATPGLQPSVSRPRAAAGGSSEQERAAIAAQGQRPYWMERCRNIQSPYLRLNQGGCWWATWWSLCLGGGGGHHA